MADLDRERVYTLYELEQKKPTSYQLLEKNYRHKKSPTYDRYKIVDIIDDVGLYDYISPTKENVLMIDGIIIIEMVRPEA